MESFLKRMGHVISLPFLPLVGWDLLLKAGAEQALCHHEVYIPRMVDE